MAFFNPEIKTYTYLLHFYHNTIKFVTGQFFFQRECPNKKIKIKKHHNSKWKIAK